MLIFPNCKINLGLNIVGKRDDGYHNIETIFFPVGIHDAAEITRAGKSAETDFDFVITGLDIPGHLTQNLCWKAWRLIKDDFPGLPPLRLHLHKRIPMGAGLGGGSSDGAHTLILINQECGLGLDSERLREYALQLGSDCPFFIYNRPCIATGRGEKITPVSLSLRGYYFVIVDPGIHVSTSRAFQTVDLKKEQGHKVLPDVAAMPPASWKEVLSNDFEAKVFGEHEALRLIKELLYAQGAVYASMSGSGSAIYGLFPAGTTPDLSDLRQQYTVFDLKQCQ